jgi:hypothetical protein
MAVESKIGLFRSWKKRRRGCLALKGMRTFGSPAFSILAREKII